MSKKKKAPISASAIKAGIMYLWIAFIAGILSFIIFIWAVGVNFLGLFGELPDFKALENPKSDLSSELY
jgi:penicillin-binding protein 1A